MNLLQRLFGKKKKPGIPERVPPTITRRSSVPMPTGISGRSLGSSSNTEEDDYYRRRQQEQNNTGLYNFMIPDDPAPATSHESGSDFGGFGGGDTGGGGASGSWDSGSSDSSSSYDSGSSDSGSSDSGGGDSGGSSD